MYRFLPPLQSPLVWLVYSKVVLWTVSAVIIINLEDRNDVVSQAELGDHEDLPPSCCAGLLHGHVVDVHGATGSATRVLNGFRDAGPEVEASLTVEIYLDAEHSQIDLILP